MIKIVTPDVSDVDLRCISWHPVGGAIYQSFPMVGRGHAQVWSYSPKFRRPRHFHAEPELNLVVAGVATFGLGDAVVGAHAGDLLAFPPGQDHVLLDGSADLAFYAIGLSAPFSSHVLDEKRDPAAAPLRIHLSGGTLRALVARLTAVAERGAVEHQVADLWLEAQRARADAVRTSGAMHVLTRRAMASISGAPELGRADLARVLRTCPTEISRHFHRDVGLTLVQFRTRVRLLRFIEHVDGQGPNLTAAALAAGFGSYSQCHRSFRDTFGCTPSRFFVTGLRQRMQNAFEPAT